MAEDITTKCIGKLTLDISDVDKKVRDVNNFLNKIGANVNLEKKLSEGIRNALNKLVNEAQKAGEEASKAIDRVGGSGKAEQKLEGLESNMVRLMSEVKTFGRTADETGHTIEKLTGTIQTGFDDAGNKIKEFVNAEGEITKRTEEVRNSIEDQIDAMWKLHDAEEAAYQKQGEAAVKAGLQREEAAAKAAQREEELTQKQVATMEESIAKRTAAEEAALEKEVASFERAEEKKRQASIEAEFEREEARRKAHQAEEETIAKEIAMMDESLAKKEADLEKEIADYEQAEERKRQAAINAEFEREEARKKSVQAEEEAIAREIAMMDEAIAKKEQEFQSGKITEAEQAYKRLTNAISQYQIAKKAGNQEQMDYWQNEMNAAMSTLSSLEKLLPELKLEESARERIVQLINAAKTQQDGFEKGVIGTSHATGELESQVKGLLTRYLSLMAVIRAISSLIKNMTEYVTEYSDKMNEIQMITLKTDVEVAQLAETYRSIAKEMNVSSLDMADAAIYFTRQGLEAEEIEKRLKNVTMYAKAANVEFKDASEIITAVVNSMGLVEQEAEDGRNAAQRVADVFLKIGDIAATSGQEIGEAMQKAAASAGAFGVSMEWLASYIATVSETTRQEARTIGTAFNTIIARLHQIKQTGYNQEDETKVNDIAKALSKIDVVLMDQEGNWRDMEDIMVDIAKEWGTLDDKTKSYIATTMAGVKQQNVFLALMNDMAKGAENGSRAFELYNAAIDSSGIAADKYAVYLDSVSAAQERLTIAEEKFYALLDQNVIKTWYDMLAGIVDYITDATDAFDGLNIILPLVAGGIYLVATAIKTLSAAAADAGSVLALLNKHPIIATISAVTIGIGLLTAAVNMANNETRRMKQAFEEADKAIDQTNQKISTYKNVQSQLAKMYEEVGEKNQLTSTELSKYNSLLDTLSSISPDAQKAVEDIREKMVLQKDTVNDLNQEINNLLLSYQKLGAVETIKKISNTYGSGGTDAGLLDYYTDWNPDLFVGETEFERFSNALKSVFERADKSYGQSWNRDIEFETKITNEAFDAISEYLEKGLDWGSISTIIWTDFFKGASSYQPVNVFAEKIKEMVSWAMDSIGQNMNDFDRSAVQEKLMSYLFEFDGTAIPKNIGEAATIISDFISQVMNEADFDASKLMTAKERLTKFAESMLGELSDDMARSIASMDDASVAKISDAYAGLIEAGFSKADITNLFKDIPIDQWVNAIGYMRVQIMNRLYRSTGVDLEDTNEDGSVNMLMWNQLDLNTMKLIEDLTNTGVALDDIKQIMRDSESVEEFNTKIDELAKNLNLTSDGGEGTAKSLKELVKDAKAGIKDIQAIDAAIESVQASLEDGSKINYGDVFGLIELHPEIMTVIGDSEKLLETLKKIREEAGKTQLNSYKDWLLSQEDIIQNTDYAGSGYKTLGEYRASLESEEAIADFDAKILKMAEDLQLADENFKQMTKDEKEAAKEAKNMAAEAQKAFKENLSEIETLDKTIEKLQSNKEVDFSDIINLSAAHPEIVAFANDSEKLIAILQRLKDEAKATTKENIKGIMMDSEEYYKESDFYDARFKTMREYIVMLQDTGGNWEQVAMYVDQSAANIENAAERTEAAAESWLEAQAQIAETTEEVNWAKANNFEEQINALQSAVETGGIEEAVRVVNGWSKEMREAISNEYPAFIKILGNADKAIDQNGKATRDLTQDTKELNAVLSSAEKLNSVKYFKDTAKAVKQLSEGTISAADAYDVLTKDLNKVTKAYEDVLSVQAKQSYNEQEKDATKHQSIIETDVTNLASLLGMTTDQILADFPGAVSMFDELIGKTGELQDVINMLNDTAFIRITGTSDADFSAIQAGLISVENLAEEAIQKLKETGQWEVVPLKMNQTAALWNWDNEEKTAGHWSYDYTTVGAQVLKPTGKNPLFTGSSSVQGKTPTNTKSRGGGGGSSKDKNDNFRDKNTTTEVEKMLDLMSQVNAIQQYQQSYYQSQNKYYSQTGQLQGVIAYMQKEKEVLEGQNGTLESNIRRIEEYMNAKQAELASLSTEDEKYKEVADDFDKLQKAHQTYTKQLIDNKSAVESLNQAMEEQRKKIRQMEIDLRNLILGAIEDREKKRTDMLNAEIEMENTIYDLIVKRYEKERDEIIRTTELKIDALNSERDLLEENLRIRKEEAEQEDKAAKLRELEVKYQRIIADPTRAKEAQQLKTEIDSLRKEMAWDIAEEEVKSQQDSIDQQIESLEDYKEYIENYYEDLFEHPQKLIAEMREIIMGTQEEIINWLKENDEAYRESSENTQLAMVTGWEETYNEMKGILKTYWDEVEEIIAQGDDYIIEFLKNNSAEYAKAGKLQAEAYVDEWKKQLDDLHKAYQSVSTEIAGSYSTIQQYNGSGSSSSSSNSGGSNKNGGSSNTNNTTSNVAETEKHGYTFVFNGTRYSDDKWSSKDRAQTAATSKIASLRTEMINSGKSATEANRYRDLAKSTLYVYKKGGIADYTGPAWVDGSPQDPERILTPYQNKLFESMVSALEKMSTLTIPSMPNFGALQTTGANPVSVGDIIVNVDNLDTDDDYEEMADRVCEILTERIGRTAVVGGLRIRST